MSWFGDSEVDKRDYGWAFGAFKGTAYLALVMAGRGELSPLDAAAFRKQMLDGIDIVPQSYLPLAGRAAVEEMFDDIERMAASHFKVD